MSNYRNFLEDYPTRCVQLLDRYQESAKTAKPNGLEVTLLLAVATAVLTGTYDRLRVNKAGKRPVMADNKAQPDLVAQVRSRLQIRLDGWIPEAVARFHSWSADRCDPDPESWPSFPDGGSHPTVQNVLKTLRNALAHGQVRTMSSNGDITEIVFLNSFKNEEDERQWAWLELSPDKLESVVRGWVELIDQYKASSGALQEVETLVRLEPLP